MVCAFTGHRPERLSWGEDETDARCRALKLRLAQLVREAYGAGCRTFLCGMARGSDTYFAEAALAARPSCPGMRLVAMIPCPSQPCLWPEAARARYDALCAACDEVCVLESSYSSGCMLRRNRAMVDAADILITVFDGAGGGTAATVRYANRRGVTIWPVWV